jgi:hypothetical protein
LERQRTIFAMMVAASILRAMPGVSQAALIAPLPADVSDDNVTKAWWGGCWRDSGALLPLLVRRLLRREHRPLPLGGTTLAGGSNSSCRLGQFPTADDSANRRSRPRRHSLCPVFSARRLQPPAIVHLIQGRYAPRCYADAGRARLVTSSRTQHCSDPRYVLRGTSAREPHLSRAQLAGRRGHDTERDWQHGSRSECDTPAGRLKSLERFVSSAAMPRSHRPCCLRSRRGRVDRRPHAGAWAAQHDGQEAERRR